MFFNWSSGKDSALALHKILQEKRYDVRLLLTTIATPQERISMHGIRKALLLQQFAQIGIPFRIVEIPEQATMQVYDEIMNRAFDELQDLGFEAAGYGDILLEDLKNYREKQLKSFGFEAVFPLWSRPTEGVVSEFLSLGFRAVVVTANSALFSSAAAGQILTPQFFAQMPSEADICGENGEYHTFCFDGPIFQKPVLFRKGKVVLREYPAPAGTDKKNLMNNGKLGFWFRDLLTA